MKSQIFIILPLKITQKFGSYRVKPLKFSSLVLSLMLILGRQFLEILKKVSFYLKKTSSKKYFLEGLELP